MISADMVFILGFLLGAGFAGVMCWAVGLAGKPQSEVDGDYADPEQGGDVEDTQDQSSAQREAVTVEGLAAALRSVGSSSARVAVVRHRHTEIRGPLSAQDVITLLEPIGSSNGRMEVFRLLARRVRSTVPDDEFAQILSVLGSRNAAEASKLLKR